MHAYDVLIVGGGPAGSTAAWKLKRGGAQVLVLDKEPFPRLKLCAGWITPEVVSDLQMDIASYPYRFLTFERLYFHYKGLSLPVSCTQHSIRRFEFDAWLLERSGAKVLQHEVRSIQVDADGCYIVDDAFRCRYLIGAGGTRCPVYRTLFRDSNPRESGLQVVTLEHEIEYDWSDPDCHLWFCENELPGYSWYVPKQSGWLNVGVGGIVDRMKQGGGEIKRHWSHLVGQLDRRYAPGAGFDPKGYSYYMRGPVNAVRRGNAFITGDAAGLATRDMAEGIGPAIRSGLRAAAAILEGQLYRLDEVTGRSLEGIIQQMPLPGFVKRALDWAAVRAIG